jgi:type I restriction-modification system DNA methylase subunit
MDAQTLQANLSQYNLETACDFWQALGYDTRDKPLLDGNFQKIAQTAPAACEPLIDAHLLYQEDALYLCHLNLRTARRSKLRQLIETLYRHYPLITYLFTARVEGSTNLLFIQPHPVLEDNQRVILAIRTLEVQPDAPTRTDLETLLALRTHPSEDAFARAQRVIDAFDVEKVTQKFYEEFRRCFEDAKEKIKGIPDEEQRSLFTLKLFNRLLFLRFLERKGWIRFGNRNDYLRALWQDYLQNRHPSDTFYSTRLKLLFFSVLNNPQQCNIMAINQAINQGEPLREVIGDAPYLNGGLFEMSPEDNQAQVPDDALQPLIEGLLYRYNFTITESTPLDIEVAVDPEMLGKVFEELITHRHESGSYYTPRPVVAFMAREALKGYLETATHETPEAIRRFVDERDANKLRDPEAVLNALRRVRVCDPACGSGAYLLGMLHELIELRTALFEQKQLDPQTLHDRKLEIIQKNLYGVDIDPFAVEIARLRLWLSLVVDDPRNPLNNPSVDVALPNLDFKIEVGDSLLAPDPQGGLEPDIFREDQIRRYDELKAQYMRTHSDEQKRMLRQQIKQLREEIRHWAHPDGKVEGFDWRVEFAEVFQEGGFDIVLANPPYVRQELIDKTIKNKLLALYPDAAEGRSDLYVYFYARALQLLKVGGMHVFVCSNSWLDVGFGGKLQAYLLKNAHIQAIYDSALERQFASADVNTIISVLRKRKPSPPDQETLVTRFVRLTAPFEQAVADTRCQRVVERTSAELWQSGLNEKGEYEGDKWGGKYLRAPDIYFTIIEKGKDKLVRLGDIAQVRFGIKTGANEFFYLEPEGRTVKAVVELREQNPLARVPVRNGAGWRGEIEAAWLRPVIKSPREVRTLQVRLEDLRYLVFMPPDDVREALEGGQSPPWSRYPKAQAYIQWGEKQGYHQRPTCASRQWWWDLQGIVSCALVLRATNDRPAVYVSKIPIAHDQTFYGISECDEIYTSMLNSTFVCWLTREIMSGASSSLGLGATWAAVYEIANLLVPNPVLIVSDPKKVLLSAFERLASRPVRSIFEELGFALCRERKCGHSEHPYEHVRPETLTLEQVRQASPDRFELDAVVFDLLGLSEAERLAVYRAVAELVKNRLVKARSV